MVIVDSGKKPLLTQNDIKSDKVDKKLNDLADKFKYQAVTVQDIKITDRGTMKVYGKMCLMQNLKRTLQNCHSKMLPEL